MEITIVVLDSPTVTLLAICQCFKFGAPYLVHQMFGAPDMIYGTKWAIVTVPVHYNIVSNAALHPLL
eukprot:14182703-Ditylum_brightwellii.AAC.1